MGSIRATIGKCKLLLSEKIPFFKNLIEMAEQQADLSTINKSNVQQRIGVNDLTGYWTLVADEIKQLDNAFERLRVWRDNNDWEPNQRPLTPMRSFIPVRRTQSKPKSTMNSHGTPIRKRTIGKVGSTNPMKV